MKIQKYGNFHITFGLILKVIILIMYVVVFFNKTVHALLEKKNFCDLNHSIEKEYFSSILKKEYFNSLSEFSYGLFKNSNNLKYQIHFRTQYNVNEENFLFFKNSIFKGASNNYFFKNISLIGFGYNIFNGPMYFSQIEFSPNLYYIYNTYCKNNFKILINNSWTYSYQLMEDVYYAQYLIALTNFNHIVIKLEHTLNFPIKRDAIFLKFSYNLILNENKLHSILPNINKYIFISLIFFL